MLDHVVFFGRMKLVTDMRWKLISGALVDWFWFLEIIFGVSAALIENRILKSNLRKIQRGDIKFVVCSIW